MSEINPDYYQFTESGVQVIDVTRHMDFVLGNALKYIARAGKKTPDPTTCYQKALWYIRFQKSQPMDWRKRVRGWLFRHEPCEVTLFLDSASPLARWLWEADRYEDRASLQKAEDWLKLYGSGLE